MSNLRDRVIHVFYRPEQVLAGSGEANFSKSPQKPRLLLDFLSRHGLDHCFVQHGDWPPFGDYLDSLVRHLADLESRLCHGAVHYVVFAHGADSHEDDDLGGQCKTAEWLKASDLVYSMLDRAGERLGRPIPLTLTLFGGYREDNYEAVLRLHAADLIRCLQIVCRRQDQELKDVFQVISAIEGR